MDPKVTRADSGAAPFPAVALSKKSSGALGLAKTDKAMFFSRNGSVEGSGVVTALLLGTDVEVDIETSITSPRGLVWDKDETMYVADEDNDIVFSFPIGRMMSNAPLTDVVTVQAPYGLMILSSQDPCFKSNAVSASAPWTGSSDQLHQGPADNATNRSGNATKGASFMQSLWPW